MKIEHGTESGIEAKGDRGEVSVSDLIRGRELCSEVEMNHGEMALVFEKGDQQLEHDAVFSTGFDGVGSGVEAKTDVHGNTSTQSLMRTELVLPGEVQRQDAAHVIGILGDSDLAGTFMLERTHEAFENGDAAVLADGTESLMNISEFLGTPGHEEGGGEVRALRISQHS